MPFSLLDAAQRACSRPASRVLTELLGVGMSAQLLINTVDFHPISQQGSLCYRAEQAQSRPTVLRGAHASAFISFKIRSKNPNFQVDKKCSKT